MEKPFQNKEVPKAAIERITISDSALEVVHNQVFRDVDCLECANCCKSAPPIVLQKDIKRIAAFLKIPPKTFKRKYVLTDIDGSMSFDRVPCVFLQEDNRCSIYEVRPEACRDFPHLTKDFKARTSLHMNNYSICPASQKIIDHIIDLIDVNNP